MDLLMLIDDAEIERKSFFTICVDRRVAKPEDCIGAPTAEVLISLVRANDLSASDITCVFVDLQLDPLDELDRRGFEAAELVRRELGNVPIVAYTRHTELREFSAITAQFDGLLLKQECADAGHFTEERFRRLLEGWRRKRGLPVVANEGSKAVLSVVRPVILHISDLQFGRAYSRPRDLADSILAGISGPEMPNVVVVSGDLAQTGNPVEYSEAGVFLERLCRGLGIREDERDRVVLCPGNHDVNWSLSLGAFVDRELQRREIPERDEAFRYRMAPYYDFCAEFYGTSGGTGLLRGEQVARVHDLRAYGVVLVSLNSSCKEDPFQAGGQIDGRSFELLDEGLRSLGDLRDSVVCAVFHHPLQVGVSAGFATNARDLIADPTGVARKLFSANVRLVFTGHIHASSLEIIMVEAGVREAGLGIVNFLAGSAGVPEGDRPSAGDAGHFANEFGIVRSINFPDQWEIEAYAYDVSSRAFLPKMKFPGPSHRRGVELPKKGTR